MSQQYEEISKKFKEWHSIWDEIESRRALWTNNTRQVVIDSLHGVRDNVFIATIQGEEKKVNWHVYTADGGIEHSESIILSFGVRPSGFKKVTTETIESISKEGGSLVFAQSYNGRVLVIITYPRINGLVLEREPFSVGSYEPSIISDDFILAKVSHFVDEIIKWERGEADMNKIGFAMNSKNSTLKEI